MGEGSSVGFRGKVCKELVIKEVVFLTIKVSYAELQYGFVIREVAKAKVKAERVRVGGARVHVVLGVVDVVAVYGTARGWV